jgi:membrane-bound ClpP family serine protease
MAMVDIYPGAPSLPTLPQLTVPLNDLALALVGAIVAILILSRVLPRTSFYPALVSQGASGVETEAAIASAQQQRIGMVGVAISTLRPGGKAQFGDEILDVVTEGDLIEPGRKVRVIGSSGTAAVVQAI